MARSTRTPKKAVPKNWRELFLAALTEDACVSYACKAAGIPRRSAYDARAADPEFAAAWDDALEQSIETLEQEARKRATAGSDTLLIFLLKAQRPHVYRERVSVELDREITNILAELAASGQAQTEGPTTGGSSAAPADD